MFFVTQKRVFFDFHSQEIPTHASSLSTLPPLPSQNSIVDLEPRNLNLAFATTNKKDIEEESEISDNTWANKYRRAKNRYNAIEQMLKDALENEASDLNDNLIDEYSDTSSNLLDQNVDDNFDEIYFDTSIEMPVNIDINNMTLHKILSFIGRGNPILHGFKIEDHPNSKNASKEFSAAIFNNTTNWFYYLCCKERGSYIKPKDHTITECIQCYKSRNESDGLNISIFSKKMIWIHIQMDIIYFLTYQSHMRWNYSLLQLLTHTSKHIFYLVQEIMLTKVMSVTLNNI